MSLERLLIDDSDPEAVVMSCWRLGDRVRTVRLATPGGFGSKVLTDMITSDTITPSDSVTVIVAPTGSGVVGRPPLAVIGNTVDIGGNDAAFAISMG